VAPDVTEDQSWAPGPAGRAAPTPGVVAVWSGKRAVLTPIAVDSPAITIGRGEDADVTIDDRRMSRRHAELSRGNGRWKVRDLDSHNGTFVDGAQISGTVERAEVAMIRTGDTLFIACADLRRFHNASIQLDDAVVGPTLRAAYDEIAAAARGGANLHIIGETGSGKELAARRFHAAGPKPNGPFVAVNCAAIPVALAEGLLFGTKKGAYSGADADRDGYFAGADGGTLFLDEIGELSADVQAKLLRVLENREVTALGATKPRAVDVRVVSATHRDLRTAVAEKAFREDLYYRLARPWVSVPALRDRKEDIPYLAVRAIAKVPGKLAVHASLVELLLLRPWPGNVRELMAELADAAGRAVAANADAVTADHLAGDAGTAITTPTPAAEIDADAVAAALEKTGGNVAAAARELGLHRNQLRRFLAKHEK
jgi:transcriptional regulator with PAS, ATPase and Fis domain